MTLFAKQLQAAPVDSSDDHLTPIAVAVLEIRTAFVDHLGSLPSPFNELAKEHYLTRLVRAEDRHMLGEYAPFLLLDVFQLPEKALSDILLPWLVLYEHNLLVDDVVDVKERLVREDVILSQLLFDDFISLWRHHFAKYPKLWQLFSKYHTEALLATSRELQKSSDIGGPLERECVEWTADYHLAMGHKSALAKFCAAVLSIEHRGRFLTANEELAFDKLCAGIQLLDDLSDSIEDYHEGRYTYPLIRAFELLQQRYDLTLFRERSLSNEEILAVLILSGVTGQVVSLSRGYLAEGVCDLQITTDTATGKYLSSLINENWRIAQTLDEIMTTNSDVVDTMVRSLLEDIGAFENLIKDPVYDSVWRQMKRLFKPVATASN